MKNAIIVLFSFFFTHTAFAQISYTVGDAAISTGFKTGKKYSVAYRKATREVAVPKNVGTASRVEVGKVTVKNGTAKKAPVSWSFGSLFRVTVTRGTRPSLYRDKDGKWRGSGMVHRQTSVSASAATGFRSKRNATGGSYGGGGYSYSAGGGSYSAGGGSRFSYSAK